MMTKPTQDTADKQKNGPKDLPPKLQTEDQKGAGPIAEPGSGGAHTDPRGPGNSGRA